MTNPFDSLVKAPDQKIEAPEPEGEEVDGVFGCDTCKLHTDVAYYTEDKTLSWTCPVGHRSVRENFYIA